jgi:hypothetical protein
VIVLGDLLGEHVHHEEEADGDHRRHDDHDPGEKHRRAVEEVARQEGRLGCSGRQGRRHREHRRKSLAQWHLDTFSSEGGFPPATPPQLQAKAKHRPFGIRRS